MGTYHTATDVRERFESDAELAHLTDADTIDTDRVNEAVNASEGEIDSALAVRHKVPANVAGSTVLAAWLKSLALDLTVARLLVRGDNVSTAKKEARDAAHEWLKAAAAGERELPSGSTEDTTESRDPQADWGIAGTTDTSHRIFSRATQSNL